MKAHKIYLPLVFLLALSFWTCQQNSLTTNLSSHSTSIPSLLDRHPQLQMGKEWENTQNQYVTRREAIKANPQALAPRLDLANIFVREARVTGEHGHYYPAALQMVEEVLKQKPQDQDIVFQSLSTKAGVELSLHQFSKALETAKEAIQLNPYNAQIYGVLVDAHVELGQYEQAIAMADKMVSIRPDTRSYSRVAYLREIYGQVEPAIEALKMAVAAAPPAQEESAWARLTLGELYHRYGYSKLAEQTFQDILLERENYPFAIAAIAQLRMDENKMEEAEALLKKACAIIPEVGFYVQLANLYQQTQRIEEANQIFAEILVMLEDDTNHGHLMNLEYAEVYASLAEDYQQALSFAKIEYQNRPANIDVNRKMAKLYFHLNNLEKAKQHLESAAITQSKDPELMHLQELLEG